MANPLIASLEKAHKAFLEGKPSKELQREVEEGLKTFTETLLKCQEEDTAGKTLEEVNYQRFLNSAAFKATAALAAQLGQELPQSFVEGLYNQFLATKEALSQVPPPKPIHFRCEVKVTSGNQGRPRKGQKIQSVRLKDHLTGRCTAPLTVLWEAFTVSQHPLTQHLGEGMMKDGKPTLPYYGEKGALTGRSWFLSLEETGKLKKGEARKFLDEWRKGQTLEDGSPRFSMVEGEAPTEETQDTTSP